MATVERNKEIWNKNYAWTQQGEEWSSAWGGSEAQWFFAILPRIHAFVPAGAILEIAPGFGRWTNYLKDWCKHLTVVDLSEKCINACKKRFAADSHIIYYVNDGKSLEIVDDQSIDFVFSFDSLVHSEADVIEKYLEQLSRKLKPNGIGFIHHSNLAHYQEVSGPTHARAASMMSSLFEDYCHRSNLKCISQEQVNWGGGPHLIDCFSVFTPKYSVWSRDNVMIENIEFGKETDLIKRLSSIYSIQLKSCMNTSAPQSYLDLIATEHDFFKNVQDPFSRVQDPSLLYQLSIQALEKYDNPYIRASALCVITHRIINNPKIVDLKGDFDVITCADQISLQLDNDETFSGIRWLVSLNMAVDFFYAEIKKDIISAITVLKKNVALFEAAFKHGQPLTNVVKSIGLLFAYAKQNPDNPLLSEQYLLEIMARLQEHSPELTRNYKFNNEFIYGDVQFIFKILYSLNRCFYQYQRNEYSCLKESLIKELNLETGHFYNKPDKLLEK